MSHISGPSSNVVGQLMPTEAGSACDNHEDTLAVVRMCGEQINGVTEYYDLCQTCFEELEVKVESSDSCEASDSCEDSQGTCEWCGEYDTLIHYRDVENKNSTGKLFIVCLPCIKSDKRKFEDASEEGGLDMENFNDPYSDSDIWDQNEYNEGYEYYECE